MSLSDAPRSDRPQSLNNEALRAAIESDSSQTCGERSARIQVSDETIRLRLHRIEKAHKLSKWIPHSLSDANKEQHVASCLPLFTRNRSASIFDRVFTNEETCVQYDTSRQACTRSSWNVCIIH
ncbi:histone-lysine N-methyltransferase SETMAR-like [Stegodyphus dumicola]|uniref:histone-lysine N-methyltransferase SETMAR-like n=1 Tax=Stegodyphus dumicola TaxID=202533 RepID=UPI0015A8355A|nr:histone-lysine N-methyltransferase SETMAR-like [Stegodyphus dumicola]